MFSKARTVTEIKKLYRQLVMENHPDRHPASEFSKWNEIMVGINAEYLKALKNVDKQETVGEDGQPHTYYYNEANETVIIEKISELVKMRMDGVEIWLVGTWIWVEGNTKPHKDRLGRNGAGLFWHSKRMMWYWKPAGYHTHYSGSDFDSLKAKYGASRYESEKQEALQ